jgi:hypothetical protein
MTNGESEVIEGHGAVFPFIHLTILLEKKMEKHTQINAVVSTYEVEIDDKYQGQNMLEIRKGLHDMFKCYKKPVAIWRGTI